MKKKIVSLMLASAMVLSLVACGSSSSSDTASSDTSSSDTSSSDTSSDSTEEAEEIVIEVFSNQADRTSGQGLIEQLLFDQYMEENPNVTIVVEALDDEGYKTKFQAYAAGTDMPDLMNCWGQPSFLDEVIDAGLLAELDWDDYDDYEYMEGSLDGFSKDGVLYGLARNTDVMGFYYNSAIFEECGVEVPETYAEYLEICETIADAGYIPVSFDGADGWPLSIYVNDIYQKLTGVDSYANAVEAVNSGDYSDPNWEIAAQLMLDAVEVGAFQTGFETTDYATSLNLFINGQSAMYYMGGWEMSMATNEDIDDSIRENIGAFLMPDVDGGEGSSTDICAWNGGGFCISATSDVLEETTELLNWMMLPENWSKLCWEYGVCMSAQNFADYLTGEETALQLEWIELVDSATSVSGVTINDLGTNSFKTICEDSSIELAIGTLTIDEFYSTLTAGMAE